MRKPINLLLSFSLLFGVLLVQPAQEVQAQDRRAAVTKRRATKRKVKIRVVRRTTRRAVTRHYYGRPHYGAVLRTVPAAARVIRFNQRAYRLHEGVYYVQRGNEYVVVRPAAGLRIRMLPNGAVRTVVRGATYHYYYGVFYAPVNDVPGEFQVVDAPVGAIVDALPEGYTLPEGDEGPLVLDEVHYQPVETDQFDDGYGYQVVAP